MRTTLNPKAESKAKAPVVKLAITKTTKQDYITIMKSAWDTMTTAELPKLAWEIVEKANSEGVMERYVALSPNKKGLKPHGKSTDFVACLDDVYGKKVNQYGVEPIVGGTIETGLFKVVPRGFKEFKVREKRAFPEAAKEGLKKYRESKQAK